MQHQYSHALSSAAVAQAVSALCLSMALCLQDQDAEQPREAAGDVKVEDADQS